jgi:hypothetical protein
VLIEGIFTYIAIIALVKRDRVNPKSLTSYSETSVCLTISVRLEKPK